MNREKSTFGQSIRADAALHITLIYLIVSILWITFSDRLLLQLADSAATLTQWQTAKGWVFVLGSALLQYVLVRRVLRERDDVAASLRQANRRLTALHRQVESYAATLEERVAARTRKLEAANEKLRSLDRLKSQFIADVTHELRTPVTNLLVYIDLLARGKAERQAHYVDVLQKQGARLHTLIEDILTLSRLEVLRTAEERSGLRPLALNDVAAHTVAAFLPQAEDKGLKLDCRPSAAPVSLSGDANQLAEAIGHLVKNALAYTQTGEVVVSVTADGPCAARVTVQDTGPGISVEDLPHVGKRFYRGEQAHGYNIPGSGLGLAIVHEIVALHNGRVEIETDEDKGTAVYLHFPTCDPAD